MECAADSGALDSGVVAPHQQSTAPALRRPPPAARSLRRTGPADVPEEGSKAELSLRTPKVGSGFKQQRASNPGDDLVEPLKGFQVREQEGAVAAHFPRVTVHDGEIGPD